MGIADGGRNLEFIGEKDLANIDREAQAWSAKRNDQSAEVEGKHLLAAAVHVKVGGVWMPLEV